MLKLNLKELNDQNLASALQKLSNLEKIDLKTRYRAGRIFDGVSSAMRKFVERMDVVKKDYMANGVFIDDDAKAEFSRISAERLSEEVIEIKSYRLEMEKLMEIDSLSGQDLVALEIVADEVPKLL